MKYEYIITQNDETNKYNKIQGQAVYPTSWDDQSCKLRTFNRPKIILFGLIQNLGRPKFAPGELTLDLRDKYFVENRKVRSILLLEMAPCR